MALEHLSSVEAYSQETALVFEHLPQQPATVTISTTTIQNSLQWAHIPLFSTSKIPSEIVIFYSVSDARSSISALQLESNADTAETLFQAKTALNSTALSSYTISVDFAVMSALSKAETIDLAIGLSYQSTEDAIAIDAVLLNFETVQEDVQAVDAIASSCISTFSLREFGSYTKSEDAANQALARASQYILSKGGGTLCIPQDAPARFTPQNTAQLNNPLHNLVANESLKLPTVGLTITDYRKGFERTYLPPAGCAESETLYGNASRIFERTLSQNLPHQLPSMAQGIFSRYLGGGSSYSFLLDRTLEDQKIPSTKEEDEQRFYVHTHRGLYVGQQLALFGIAAELEVAEVGQELVGPSNKETAYFICNTTVEIAKGSAIHSQETNALLATTIQDTPQSDRAKFYIPIVNKSTISPGSSIVVRTGKYIIIKRLDKDSLGFYFVPQTRQGITKGEYISNKNIVGGLIIIDTANCDNQSPSLKIVRNSYGAGDTFGTWNELNYQSNIMSSGGDEGAVGSACELKHDLNCFRGSVENWDDKNLALTYHYSSTSEGKLNPANPHKIGTSRPLINMNQARWITAGTVQVISAGYPSEREKILRESALKNGEAGLQKAFTLDANGGKSYPRKSTSLIVGRGVFWTRALIGRFFAISDKSERYDPGDSYYDADGGKVQETTYRWWHITDLEERSDGAFNLYVEEAIWNNTFAIKGGPRLFRADNYTYGERHTRDLEYAIAPGAWVADVRDAVAVPRAGQVGLALAAHKRTIQLAPSSAIGSDELEALFVKGDPIANPAGSAPWNPTGFRARHFAGFPTSQVTASFVSRNAGKVQMSAGLFVRDTYASRDWEYVVKQQKDGKPSFKSGVQVSASTEYGLFVDGTFQHAAICVHNPSTSLNTLSDGYGISGLDLYKIKDDKTGIPRLRRAGLRVNTATDAAIDLWAASGDQNQSIQWLWYDAQSVTHFSVLTISPGSGNFVFKVMPLVVEDEAAETPGGNIDFSGKGSLQQQGLSQTAIAAKNLRGININVSTHREKDSIYKIPFSQPEIDDNYCIQVETSWLTQKAILKKETDGFTIQFDASPDEKAVLDWLLVR